MVHFDLLPGWPLTAGVAVRNADLEWLVIIEKVTIFEEIASVDDFSVAVLRFACGGPPRSVLAILLDGCLHTDTPTIMGTATIKW